MAAEAPNYDVFISYRFLEAGDEAKALEKALKQRLVKVYRCQEAPGSDLQDAIAHALCNSTVQVLLATETYGKKTNPFYSTRQEMNHSLEEGRPFLVKMCKKWKDNVARVVLKGLTYVVWTPKSPMPDDMVDQIINCIRKGRPRSKSKSVRAIESKTETKDSGSDSEVDSDSSEDDSDDSESGAGIDNGLADLLRRLELQRRARSEETPTFHCKCGEVLEMMEARKCYGGPGMIGCDYCGEPKMGSERIYHCPDGYNDDHPQGFDMCETCAKVISRANGGSSGLEAFDFGRTTASDIEDALRRFQDDDDDNWLFKAF